jgi:hypothetical protein
VLGPSGSRRPDQAAAAAALVRTAGGDLGAWEQAPDRHPQHVQDLVTTAADQLRGPATTAASGGVRP